MDCSWSACTPKAFPEAYGKPCCPHIVYVGVPKVERDGRASQLRSGKWIVQAFSFVQVVLVFAGTLCKHVILDIEASPALSRNPPPPKNYGVDSSSFLPTSNTTQNKQRDSNHVIRKVIHLPGMHNLNVAKHLGHPKPNNSSRATPAPPLFALLQRRTTSTSKSSRPSLPRAFLLSTSRSTSSERSQPSSAQTATPSTSALPLPSTVSREIPNLQWWLPLELNVALRSRQ